MAGDDAAARRGRRPAGNGPDVPPVRSARSPSAGRPRKVATPPARTEPRKQRSSQPRTQPRTQQPPRQPSRQPPRQPSQQRTPRPTQQRTARPTGQRARPQHPPPPRRPVPRSPWRPPADPTRRSRVALVLMLFLLSLFGGRLVQVQGLDASALAAQALDSRTQSRLLFAHRGDIVDSTGDPLATTVELRDLLVDQTLVGQYKRRVGEDRAAVGLEGAAEDLAPLLGLPVATVVKRLTGSSRGATLATGVAPDVAREILRLAVPGVVAYQASKRVYPNGEVAANLLGFVGADGKAGGGLE